MGSIFTYQDPNFQPKDTATTRGSRRRQTTDTQGKVEGNQRELMEGYAHLQVVYVAPANGEREAHGVGFACWRARKALAGWPLGGAAPVKGVLLREDARGTRGRGSTPICGLGMRASSYRARSTLAQRIVRKGHSWVV